MQRHNVVVMILEFLYKIDEVGCWHKSSYYRANGILTKKLVRDADALRTQLLSLRYLTGSVKLTLVYAPMNSLDIGEYNEN